MAQEKKRDDSFDDTWRGKMDGKIDTLSATVAEMADALKTLIRIEERLLSQGKNQDRLQGEMNLLKDRVRDYEIKEAGTSTTVTFNERIYWAILTAGIGLLVYFIKG